MKSTVLIILVTVFCGIAAAVPRIAVFPFEPLIDSTYNIWRDQVKVLNYQRALHGFIVSDMSQSEHVEIIKIDTLVTSIAAALAAAKDVNADFAVIGSYAELPSAIRGDARLVDVGLGDVPRGYQASATARRWEDLSSVAEDLSSQLLDMIGASSTVRKESVSRLIVEGDRAALGFETGELARLIVEVNSPAPKITLSSGSELGRCTVRDRSLSDGSASTQICFFGDVATGEQTISIDQRGYYGHEESLNLSKEKVYWLIVELQPMLFQSVPAPQ